MWMSHPLHKKATLNLDEIEIEKDVKPILYEYGQLNNAILGELKVLQAVEFVTA